MIENKDIRRRVSFSTSVKGIVTPEVTVEYLNGSKEETLNEAEDLLKEAMRIAKHYSTIIKE